LGKEIEVKLVTGGDSNESQWSHVNICGHLIQGGRMTRTGRFLSDPIVREVLSVHGLAPFSTRRCGKWNCIGQV
jgi:hypothetical protein